MSWYQDENEAEIVVDPDEQVPDDETIAAAKDEATGRQLRGAAIAGGLLGLAVAGPAVAAVAGVGAAVVAATNTGTAGEVVRKCGGATTAVCGSTIAACGKVKRLSGEHQLVGKSLKKMKVDAVF